jgi:hypothetical protein
MKLLEEYKPGNLVFVRHEQRRLVAPPNFTYGRFQRQSERRSYKKRTNMYVNTSVLTTMPGDAIMPEWWFCAKMLNFKSE